MMFKARRLGRGHPGGSGTRASGWAVEEGDQGDRDWLRASQVSKGMWPRTACVLAGIMEEWPVREDLRQDLEVSVARERWLLLWAAALAMVPVLSAQAPKPTFDVASVKKIDPSAPFVPTKTYPLDSAVYAPPNATVSSLIAFAYNVLENQVVGGPDWIRWDHFEIDARSAGESSADEKRLMVQSLLEERFGLVVHEEQRRTELGSLVMARDDGRPGPGLTQCDDLSAPAAQVVWPRGGRLSARRCAPMSAVADVAARILELPVIDKTGLTGLWNHLLTYADPRPLPPGVNADPNLTPFPTALVEQLSLRVETGVGLVDVLVVDSVQQPTEN